MVKNKIILLFFYSMVTALMPHQSSVAGDIDWRVYSKEENGDVYFFDPVRVKRDSKRHTVWTRIQYKTSVMGAWSYQSRLQVDCAERTERILQKTFFSDRQWEKPAMSTDMEEKPERPIVAGSAANRLWAILCEG